MIALSLALILAAFHWGFCVVVFVAPLHYYQVDEVRHWMTMALDAQPDSGTYRLLALVGPPGSAKTTMVRLLSLIHI